MTLLEFLNDKGNKYFVLAVLFVFGFCISMIIEAWRKK